MSLFNLFGKPKVEKRHDDIDDDFMLPIQGTESDHLPLPSKPTKPVFENHNAPTKAIDPAIPPEWLVDSSLPALSSVYALAVKAAVAQTPSPEEQSAFRFQSTIKHSPTTSSEGYSPDLSSSGRPIRLQSRIFALLPGSLLVYSDKGPNERLPEKSLKLTKDSVAVASDLVPGKPYTIQVADITKIQGESITTTSAPSLLTRLKIKSSISPAQSPSILIIFDTSLQLEEWLRALRKEIEAVGGPNVTDTQKQQGRYTRSDSLDPIPFSHRTSLDVQSTISRPSSRMNTSMRSKTEPFLQRLDTTVQITRQTSASTYTEGVNEARHPSRPSQSPKIKTSPTGRRGSIVSPTEPLSPSRASIRSTSSRTTSTKSGRSRRSQQPGGATRSVPHIASCPTSPIATRRSPQSESFGKYVGSLQDKPLPDDPKQRTSPIVAEVTKASASAGADSLSKQYRAGRSQQAPPPKPLRSVSSLSSIRSTVPPTIDEVATPSSPIKDGVTVQKQPAVRQLHSIKPILLPIRTNGQNLYRSGSHTTLQQLTDDTTRPYDRRRSSSLTSTESSAQFYDTGSARSPKSFSKPFQLPVAAGPESKFVDGEAVTSDAVKRRPSSKLSLFPSPVSPPVNAHPFSPAVATSRSNTKADKILGRPTSMETRPNATPVVGSARSMTADGSVHASNQRPVGLGLQIPISHVNTRGDGSDTTTSSSEAMGFPNNVNPSNVISGRKTPTLRSPTEAKSGTRSLPRLDLGLPIAGLAPPAPPPRAPLPQLPPASRSQTPLPMEY